MATRKPRLHFMVCIRDDNGCYDEDIGLACERKVGPKTQYVREPEELIFKPGRACKECLAYVEACG